MIKKIDKKPSAKKDDKADEILETVNLVLETVNFIKDNAVSKLEFDKLQKDFNALKADVVTKDYLDNKLADLRGDLVVLTRKEDTKMKELVKILLGKKILSKMEVKRILTMEPFPQLAL